MTLLRTDCPLSLAEADLQFLGNERESNLERSECGKVFCAERDERLE